MQVHLVQECTGAFRVEKAPKGKSQERCRPETAVDQGSEGGNRREGNQTLRAERSRVVLPA